MERGARSQAEHARINACEYPGTRQLCTLCGCPTARSEEDALYTDSGAGPLCEECYDEGVGEAERER